MSRRAAVGLVVALLWACGDLSGPAPGDVQAALVPTGLLVHNHRDRAIHYIAVERETAALIDWIACVDDGQGRCPSIDAGAELLIPYDSILGWGPAAAEVLFYWWHTVPTASGGLAVDSIRTLIVGG